MSGAALPPKLRRHWRGYPRLLLEDTPAPQLAESLPLRPDDRLLALGPDAPLLASSLAAAARLEHPPLALIGGRAAGTGAVETLAVDVLRGCADRLPLPDASVSVVIAPHQIRRWDDARLLRVLEEVWRALTHNGICVLWEVGPSRSPQLNALWRVWLGDGPRLRSFAEIGRLAYEAQFAWVQTLALRPFLWPPGPRVSVLMRKEHYTPEVLTRPQPLSDK